MLYGDISGRQEPTDPTPTTTVIDDFETGSLDAAWVGDRDGMVVQSTTAIEGTYSLRCTSSFETVVNTEVTTSPGNHYRTRFMYPATGSDTQLLIQCQSNTNTTRDNCYLFWPSTTNGYFFIRKMSGGSTQWTEYSVDNVTFSPDTEYQMAIEFAANGTDLRGILYDGAGTEISHTAWHTDSSPYTGGTLGLYAEATDCYFDYVTTYAL